jgi:hypothetical protein
MRNAAAGMRNCRSASFTIFPFRHSASAAVDSLRDDDSLLPRRDITHSGASARLSAGCRYRLHAPAVYYRRKAARQ